DWHIQIYGDASSDLRHFAAQCGLPIHEFPWGEAAHQAGFERDSLYVVRPDGYVGLTGMRQDLDKLRSYLSRFKIAVAS
ncbi:MAG: monooxygenase, partial [Deltaproteobacteria bacterium]|nr:monooxygenase [Deltaproteobacteria bacterium]